MESKNEVKFSKGKLFDKVELSKLLIPFNDLASEASYDFMIYANDGPEAIFERVLDK